MQVELQNQNNTARKIVTAGGIGAIVGATARGGHNYIEQINILKNGDVYVKQMEGECAKQLEYCTPFFKGTQEAADIAKQALQNNLNKIKEFVSNGKIDFRQVAKQAGIGALIAGATWAGIYALIQLVKKEDKEHVQQNAKILAEELNKAKN